MGLCGCGNNSSILPSGGNGAMGPAGPPGNFEITDILYADLVTLQGTSALVEGLYRITDYQTTGNIPNAAASVLGPVEPLIIMALNTSSLSYLVWSEDHPEDIIHYELVDTSTQGAIMGRIYYRKSTLKDLATPYDWRAWLFRRWETSIGSGIFTEFTDPGGGEASQDAYTFANDATGGTCSSIKIDEISTGDAALNGAPTDLLNNILISADSYNITFDKSCYNINLNGAVAKNDKFKPLSNTLDLTGATHVYAIYDCEIFTNATPATYLSYYDAANALNVVLPTA